MSLCEIAKIVRDKKEDPLTYSRLIKIIDISKMNITSMTDGEIYCHYVKMNDVMGDGLICKDIDGYCGRLIKYMDS